MKHALVSLALLGACSVASAEQWIGAQTSVTQIALDYERSPALADQKYRNAELTIPRAAVLGAPASFPSGRTYLPLMGLGADAPAVRAILPSAEIPASIGKSSEVSLTCTVQGLYSPDGRAVASQKDGLLVLACGNLRTLR
ncbi:hypothetical protein [Paraburkholderia bannensis]|uniref:hypothetical protein n=1 Tax=Paraburkholderia bannensis TaxID=765414 RepID=UPI00048663AE|nr:hypothetical protein [Paraburkholderia bannensis]